MRIILVFVSLLISSSFVQAQDREGNDTPGDWTGTHNKLFDLWASNCDYRDSLTQGEPREERCYIRYVDVFSQRPKFGAVFLFITPEPVGYKIAFGFEKGTKFSDDGIHIKQGEKQSWAFSDDACLSGGSCEFYLDDAQQLAEAMSVGDTINMNFVDRHDQPQSLVWDLSVFKNVLDDFDRETDKRALRN